MSLSGSDASTLGSAVLGAGMKTTRPHTTLYRKANSRRAVLVEKKDLGYINGNIFTIGGNTLRFSFEEHEKD